MNNLEYKDGKSHKFWKIELNGNVFKVLFLLALLVLSGCGSTNKSASKSQVEEEIKVINLDTLETDTTGWSDYYLGYHTLKVPPGLTAFLDRTTNIDWHYPSIVRNYPASARHYIESHKRFGGMVFQTQLNGWEFIVAKERRSSGRVSTRALVFFGAKKIDSDIVVFTKEASRSLVGDGSDAKYRAFYEKLDVKPVTPQNRKQGFCYGGYLFSGYAPQHLYDFSASFSSQLRHGYSVSLSQKMKAPPKDDRPMALPPSDIPPSIQITESALTKGGHNGVITRVLGVGEEADQGYLKVFIVGPYGDIENPVIDSYTISEIKQDIQEKEHEYLSFLASIQSN